MYVFVIRRLIYIRYIGEFPVTLLYSLCWVIFQLTLQTLCCSAHMVSVGSVCFWWSSDYLWSNGWSVAWSNSVPACLWHSFVYLWPDAAMFTAYLWFLMQSGLFFRRLSVEQLCFCEHHVVHLCKMCCYRIINLNPKSWQDDFSSSLLVCIVYDAFGCTFYFVCTSVLLYTTCKTSTQLQQDWKYLWGL